jgi:hypothetical protein
LFGFLGIVGLAGFAATVLATTYVISAWLGSPIIFGYSEGPTQPIAFPHTVHVQQLGLDCTFCHRNVTKGAAATIPAVALCMSCHEVVGDGLAEVQKLRDTFDAGQSINWVRVHRVPDHVHFIHEVHVRRFSGVRTVVERITDPQTQIRLNEAREIKSGASVGETLDIAASSTCTICHGNVGGMVKVEQIRSLKMGDCVDCHRDNEAPTDCTTCHY